MNTGIVSQQRDCGLVCGSDHLTNGAVGSAGGASTDAGLRPGEVIEVRSEAEILATLDDRGELDGLPFMPEMLQYSGRRFRVFKIAHKTCDTIDYAGFGLRRMQSAVHLEGVRCDGGAHDGCQAACLVFWKEAWLKRVVTSATRSLGVPGAAGNSRPGSCTVETLVQSTRVGSDAAGAEVQRYSCQATELNRATSTLSWWNLGQYVRDVRDNGVRPRELVRALLVWLFNKVQDLRQGTSYPLTFRMGAREWLAKTPEVRLDLRPGELVQVKSRREILATLDAGHKNRGLTFDREMVRFCGQTFRVLRRVDRLIHDRNGRMLKISNDCIILEGVTCSGEYNKFCPRNVYPYWREIWLKRAEPAGGS